MSHKIQAKASVGAKEFIAMLTLFVATNAFLTYPRYVSASGLEAAWMEPLIAGIATLLLFVFVERLLSAFFPGMDIVEVCKETFGKWIAVFFAILFSAYFIFSTAAVIRQFTENVITTVLPSTPILFVGGLFAFAVAYIAYAGLEGICRTAYFLLPILIIGTIGLCILTINWWHPLYLFPIWGTGIQSVLIGAMKYSPIFTNVLLLCVIYPHAHNPNEFRWIGTASITLSTLVLVFFILTYHMVFAPTETGKSTFAFYQMARMIYLGRFIQRMESVFIFLWVSAAVVKMAVTLWGAAYLMSKAFGWETYRPAVPALALCCFSLSLWFGNLLQVMEIEETYLMSWGGIIVFILPVFIVLFGVLRHYLRNRRGGAVHA